MTKRLDNNQEYFQIYMPGDSCFGCGTNNAHGLQIRSFWDGDECICVWQPKTDHQGWSNLTCGGILATLIDCHCMASAMATAIKNEGRPLNSEPHYRFATGSLNIKYLKPTPLSNPVTLRAHVDNIRDNRIYTLHCDLYSDTEKTVEANVIAFLVHRSNDLASDSVFNISNGNGNR